MNIRLFFEQHQNKTKKKKLTDNEKNTIRTKKKHKQRFVNLMGKFVSDEIIDMLEYSHMMEFYKSGGTLVSMGRYNQIMEKILNSDANNKNKDQLSETVHIIFTHLHDLVKEDNSIDITLLIEGIVKHNKNLLKFTNDQQEGIKQICSFLYNPNEYTFSLRGFAGTGKTTTITKLIHYLILHNYIKSVVFAAPTNKAVNVMKSKFRNDIGDLIKLKLNNDIDKDASFMEQLDLLDDKGFKINFVTIHKLLNYKNDFDYNGNRIFVKGRETLIDKYDLVVIDECSMIPMQIVVNIFEDIRLRKNKKIRDNVIKKIPKILFVGDPAQLPPVNEKVSIIFAEKDSDFNLKQFVNVVPEDDNYFDHNPSATMKNRFDELKKDITEHKSYTLEHIVRSSNANVIGLCNNVRSWVMGLVDKPKIGAFKGKKVKFYEYKKGDKLKTKWFRECLKHFKANTEDSYGSNIILTWTNKQCDTYNKAIRQQLFGRKNLKRFEIGDILILKDFYNFEETEVKYKINDKNKSDQDSGKKFYTSEQIRVNSIDTTIKACPLFCSNLPRKLLKIRNFNAIEDKFSQVVKSINKYTVRKYPVYKLMVAKLCGDEIAEDNAIDEQKIYVLKEGNEVIELLNNDKEYTSTKIRELRNYYRTLYADRIKQIDRDIIRPLWREWSRRFIDPFANVDYGTTISVHRCQGSSFYNVFVDADNIFLNKSHNEAKRCIYTAVTRTSNELHILI
jgi:hypothetical protein